MTAPVPTFRLDGWMTSRFTRENRYYRLHVEQDRWGEWILARVNGRIR